MKRVRRITLNTPLPRSPHLCDEDSEVIVPAYVPDGKGGYAVRPLRTTWRFVKEQLESQMDRYDELPKTQRDRMKIALAREQPHPYELQDLRRLDPKTKL